MIFRNLWPARSGVINAFSSLIVGWFPWQFVSCWTRFFASSLQILGRGCPPIGVPRTWCMCWLDSVKLWPLGKKNVLVGISKWFTSQKMICFGKLLHAKSSRWWNPILLTSSFCFESSAAVTSRNFGNDNLVVKDCC